MSESRTYYYARVSSSDQNADSQLDAFHNLGAKEKYIFIDKCSGQNLNVNRDNYLMLRNFILRSGDTLVIKSLDSLSKNKLDVRNELQYYRKNGIKVRIIDLPTTMIDLDGQNQSLDMVNSVLIEVLSLVAEQESQNISNPAYNLPDNWDEIYYRYKSRELKAEDAMALLGIKRNTFFNYIRAYELKHELKWNSPDIKNGA